MTPSLSVCCMTSGEEPSRLGAMLSLLRDLADEIVVAVDDVRADETAAAVDGVADSLHAFPRLDPPDRPIPWLFGLCSGDWILNVDDDEVPSRRLLGELPGLLRRDDVTHYWIGRRWLYGDAGSWLDALPWHPEYQLRLVLRDERWLQFSDEFHRPVVCHGPMRFVESPLWHLDLLVHDLDCRRRKVRRYERERHGMRIAGLAHNAAVYLPELREPQRSAPLPADERALVERVLGGRLVDAPVRTMRRLAAGREEIDAFWPGELDPQRLHRGLVEPAQRVDALVAGVQQTLDVLVTNLSDTVWRWGKEAQPEIRLAYRWHGATGQVRGGPDLRTPFPADLRPGETQLVPVHVVPPEEPATYSLEVDLVHEFVRWFGCGFRLEVEVRPRHRVAMVGDDGALAALIDALEAVPDVEPVRLVPDAEPPPQRYGLHRIPGLRGRLGGLDTHSRARLLATLLPRSLALVALPSNGTDLLARELGCCDALVIATPDWGPDAAETRELWRLATTVLVARRLGVEIYLTGNVLPRRGSSLDRLLERVIRRASRPVAIAELSELFGAGGR